MIAEIFSTSFLFSIAIIIILVGGLFAYFNHRFSEQNHKMQSMLGLVSTMAEEMQYFRSKLNSRQDEHNRMPDADIIQFIPNFLGGNGNVRVRVEDNDLIEVSDSESVEDDECDSECDDSDVDSYASSNEVEEEDSDVDSYASSSSNEEEVEEDSDVEVVEEERERKIISIDLGINNEFVIESEDITETNDETINGEINGEIKSVNLEDIDMSLKSISIDGFGDISFSNNKGKGEYKKLSLSKLREVVVEKGLIIDSSKLKKNELLKMLGDE